MSEYIPSQDLIQKTIETYKEQGKEITETEAAEIVRTLRSFAKILIDCYNKLSAEEKEKLEKEHET